MANLTENELEAAQRHLAGEKLLIKKYKAYAEKAADTKIRTKFEQTAAKHENHFEKLMKLLK